ncbi:MAG: cytochrome c [Geminicoccaceae bacterium]|jgi:cytochrome c55X|nr:cytochrome c [Geminicoccaceae bacterium]HRY26797.1 cytochrome c [Geminicoccaceae bacterium]
MPAASWVDRLALGLVIGGVAIAGPAGSAAAAEPSLQRQDELIHLLRHDCGSCHGLTLKGGLGPPLLPDALADQPAESLVAIILDGVPGRPMPPWRGLLPEDEVVWLVGRLQEGIGDAR